MSNDKKKKATTEKPASSSFPARRESTPSVIPRIEEEQHSDMLSLREVTDFVNYLLGAPDPSNPLQRAFASSSVLLQRSKEKKDAPITFEEEILSDVQVIPKFRNLHQSVAEVTALRNEEIKQLFNTLLLSCMKEVFGHIDASKEPLALAIRNYQSKIQKHSRLPKSKIADMVANINFSLSQHEGEYIATLKQLIAIHKFSEFIADNIFGALKSSPRTSTLSDEINTLESETSDAIINYLKECLLTKLRDYLSSSEHNDRFTKKGLVDLISSLGFSASIMEKYFWQCESNTAKKEYTRDFCVCLENVRAFNNTMKQINVEAKEEITPIIDGFVLDTHLEKTVRLLFSSTHKHEKETSLSSLILSSFLGNFDLLKNLIGKAVITFDEKSLLLEELSTITSASMHDKPRYLYFKKSVYADVFNCFDKIKDYHPKKGPAFFINVVIVCYLTFRLNNICDKYRETQPNISAFIKENLISDLFNTLNKKERPLYTLFKQETNGTFNIKPVPTQPIFEHSSLNSNSSTSSLSQSCSNIGNSAATPARRIKLHDMAPLSLATITSSDSLSISRDLTEDSKTPQSARTPSSNANFSSASQSSAARRDSSTNIEGWLLSPRQSPKSDASPPVGKTNSEETYINSAGLFQIKRTRSASIKENATAATQSSASTDVRASSCSAAPIVNSLACASSK